MSSAEIREEVILKLKGRTHSSEDSEHDAITPRSHVQFLRNTHIHKNVYLTFMYVYIV